MSLLLGFAVICNGILAGASVDVALVKLPTRRRIGGVAYAAFARCNDLGNGFFFYPAAAVSAAVLAFASTIAAFAWPAPEAARLLLAGSSLTSVLHFVGTALAAPVMLSLRNTPPDEDETNRVLDRFAHRHAFRTVFQVVTFTLLVAALAVSR